MSFFPSIPPKVNNTLRANQTKRESTMWTPRSVSEYICLQFYTTWCFYQTKQVCFSLSILSTIHFVHWQRGFDFLVQKKKPEYQKERSSSSVGGATIVFLNKINDTALQVIKPNGRKETAVGVQEHERKTKMTLCGDLITFLEQNQACSIRKRCFSKTSLMGHWFPAQKVCIAYPLLANEPTANNTVF